MTLMGFEAAKPKKKREDQPSNQPMRSSSVPAAQRRNLTHDEKRYKREQRVRKTAFSGPGYYLVDKDGTPQSEPFASMSEAEAQLQPESGHLIQYLTQAPNAAHIAEPFPPNLQQVNGSLMTLASHTHDDEFLFVASSDEDGDEDTSRGEADTEEHPDCSHCHHSFSSHGSTNGGPCEVCSCEHYDAGGEEGEGGGEEKEASLLPPGMTYQQREAQILSAMAVASLPEQQALMGELDGLRREARMAFEAEREIDLSSAIVRDTLTPVRVHEHHTASTDWIDDVAEPGYTPQQVFRAMVTEAKLWSDRVSSAVKADREEYVEQAHGTARRLASTMGEHNEAAYQFFMKAAGAWGDGGEPEAAVAPWGAPPMQLPPVGGGDAPFGVPSGGGGLNGQNFNPMAEEVFPGSQVLPLDNGASAWPPADNLEGEGPLPPVAPDNYNPVGTETHMSSLRYVLADAENLSDAPRSQWDNPNAPLDCGHPSTIDPVPPGGAGAAGYATTAEGKKICYDCADDQQREEMKTADRYSGYLSKNKLTTWTGGHLGDVIHHSKSKGYTPTGGPYERHHIQVRDLHGNMWHGSGPGEGMYVNIRRMKGRTSAISLEGMTRDTGDHLIDVDHGSNGLSWSVRHKGTGQTVASGNASNGDQAHSLAETAILQSGGRLNSTYEEFMRDKAQEAASRSRAANRRTASEAFNGPKQTYTDYLSRLSEGAAQMDPEHYAGSMAAVSPAPDNTSIPVTGSMVRWGERGIDPDPTGADLAGNPMAGYPEGGNFDKDQAHAQSGEAQTNLPLAPQGPKVTQYLDWITDFPDTGPGEVPSDRAPMIAENAGPDQDEDAENDAFKQSLSSLSVLSEERPLDERPHFFERYANTRYCKNCGEDPNHAMHIEAARVAKDKVPGRGVDQQGSEFEPNRGGYAMSPEGDASATQDFEQAYSSDRHIDYSETGIGQLGTVPVQGYGANPHGEMFAWQVPPGPGPVGAADVMNVPTPGAAAGGYPQPQGAPEAPEGKEARLQAARARVAATLGGGR